MGLGLVLILTALTALAARFDALAAQPMGAKPTKDEGHMCVFCHRLAGSKTQALVPLWQPSVRTSDGFSLFPVGDPSEPERVKSRDSSSVVCLSCHETGEGPIQGQFRYGHPFAVPYGGAPQAQAIFERRSGADYAWRRSVVGREGFRPALRSATGRGWRVPVFGSASGLPLFTRDDPAGGDTPFIECETCHDPHNKEPQFLRVARGQLCFACHNL